MRKISKTLYIPQDCSLDETRRAIGMVRQSLLKAGAVNIDHVGHVIENFFRVDISGLVGNDSLKKNPKAYEIMEI